MDLLTQIIVVVLTSSAVASAVVMAGGFLAKSIIDRWITMSLKRYETSLQMSLESYKTSLQQSALEHQTRFTKLHERRVEVIAELYKRLARAHSSFEGLTAVRLNENEWWKQENLMDESWWRENVMMAGKRAIALHRYATEHRLYLGDEVGDKLEKLLGDYMVEFIRLSHLSPESISNRDQLFEIFQKIATDMREMQKDIENDFRRMLGESKKSGV